MRDEDEIMQDIKNFWQFMKDTNPKFQEQMKNEDRKGCVITVTNSNETYGKRESTS